MGDITRRTLLTASAATAAGLALAGCAPRPTEHHTPPPTPTPTRTPSATEADWTALAAAVAGTLFRPGDEGYDDARRTENPRYDDARPLGILRGAGPEDMARGLAFARRHGVPLALRSGGHSYPGWSAGGASGTGMPPALVLDTRSLDAVHLDGKTARIGAGAPLSRVYRELGSRGRALAAGSCATVGVSGLTLGGGVGVLTRAYGLTCDALTEVEIVTADGTVRRASAAKDPDLFWACRGGGGGHLGLVTALTFETSDAPEVTKFVLTWPWRAAPAVVDRWLRWASKADPRLWTTLKLLAGKRHADGPALTLSGTWIGPAGGEEEALDGLLSKVRVQPIDRQVSRVGYLDAMLAYASCADLSPEQCSTGPDGELPLEPFSATSHMPRKHLDQKGVGMLIGRIEAAQNLRGLTEGGVSLDALGGRVADKGPDETAFVHRRALASVQYTATYETGADPKPYDRYVHDFRDAMTAFWGDSAYVNYADPTLAHPEKAYFGSNAKRLAQVRRRYDPHGLFTQPQAY